MHQSANPRVDNSRHGPRVNVNQQPPKIEPSSQAHGTSKHIRVNVSQ